MKKSLIILMVLIFTAVLFPACLTDAGVDVEEIENGVFPYFVNNIETNKAYIFKSVVQIEEYIEQIETKYFNDTELFHPKYSEDREEYWKNEIKPNLVESFNKYNDAFFTHSNLVMVLWVERNKPIKIKIEKIGVKNNEFYIRIKRNIPIGPQATDSLPGACFLIPVKSSIFHGDKVIIETRNTYW